MSLHAHIRSEVHARLIAQRRSSTIAALVISFLVLFLVGLLLMALALPRMATEAPMLVTYHAPLQDDSPQEEVTQVKPMRHQPPAPVSVRMIAANADAPMAIPIPAIDLHSDAMEFGDSMDFGANWGDPSPSGGFGGIPSAMRKRCSRQDRLERLQQTGGTSQCEEAVEKGLEWLKKTQNSDGSWRRRWQAGMTGLGLLAYLGRCETPISVKYGESSSLAITYLIDLGLKNQGKLTVNPADSHWPYEHAIATYALAEAATFCRQLEIDIPHLYEVTQQAGQLIIDQQHASGGWDYHYQTKGKRGGDLSIAAWHMQALKAMKHSEIAFRGLDEAVQRGLRYVTSMQNKAGGFGYKTPDFAGDGCAYFTMTGGGVLALQMWGKGQSSACRHGIRYLSENTRFDYHTQYSDLYGHYYEAQAMINAGGVAWERYNAMFRDQLLQNQNRDGSWQAPGKGKPIRAAAYSEYVKNPHYRTCLNVLMLEVYYRFLPGTGAGVP